MQIVKITLISLSQAGFLARTISESFFDDFKDTSNTTTSTCSFFLGSSYSLSLKKFLMFDKVCRFFIGPDP